MRRPTTKQAKAIASTPDHVLRIPFQVAGCLLHRRHDPDPASSELHHVFPLYLQAQKFPGVDPNHPASAHDKERWPLCGTGHSDVHLAITALLEGKPKPRGVGNAEQALAKEALARLNA